MSLRPSGFGFRIVALLTAGIALVASQASAADEVIDRVLAVAGGELITQSDVAAARALGLVTPPQGEDAAAQTHDVVSHLIDRALMLAEVDRYAPPEPSPEAVDREVAAVRARFPSQSAMEATLARVGLDDEYLRELLRQNLRIQAYIEERFAVPEDERRTLVDEWVAGLRRRATISEPDVTAR
jgi:hypothetical protein